MILNDDVRNIKLTLSSFCYERLKSDCSICNITTSKLIELVILDYCYWSKKISEIDSLKEMFQLFASGKEIRFITTITSLFLKDEIHRHSFVESKTYNWTITQKAREALNRDDISCNEGGSFITDILEEYVSMNYSVREKIMLRKKIEVIDNAIKHNNILRFITRKGTTKDFMPYKIVVDSNMQYNYLLGYTVDNGVKTKVGSHRIFSFNEVKEIRSNIKSDFDSIDKTIQGRNVAYLWNDETEIKVKLSKTGQHNFDLIIHNRPKLVKKNTIDEEYAIYELECTEFQAMIYFQSFGKDAQVLYPESLVEKMKEFYRCALNAYESELFIAK